MPAPGPAHPPRPLEVTLVRAPSVSTPIPTPPPTPPRNVEPTRPPDERPKPTPAAALRPRPSRASPPPARPSPPNEVVPVEPTPVRVAESTPEPVATPQPVVEPAPSEAPLAQAAPAPTPAALAQPTAAPTPAAATSPAPTSAPVPAGTAAPATAITPAPAPGLPARGTLRYVLTVGSPGLRIGRETIAWDFTGGRYRITGSTEASGLVRVFWHGRLEQVSSGSYDAAGLRPEHFEQRGRGGPDQVERVEFDRTAGRLRFDPAGNDAPLEPGTQDLLSFLFQFALHPPESGAVASPVTNGRKVSSYRYEWVDEQTLKFDFGIFRTLHLVRLYAVGEDALELFTAADRFNLPLEIRFTDRHGRRFALRATALDVP